MHNPESPPPIIEDRPFRSSSSGSRLPPQDLDAERAVLGSILIHNDAVFTALEELVPEDFYRPGHQLIMRAMTELATKSEPVDTVTLSAVLKGKGELEAVGGLAAIVALSTAVPTAANVKYYADIVRKKSTLRKLISAATEIVTQSYEAPDPDVVVDDAERMVFEVCQTKARQGITRIDKVVAEAFRRIEKLAEQKKDITGVATGIGDLDGLTAGLQPSDLIIVAGRPSMGKCLAADSEIVLEDGSIATIEELVRAKNARLFTLDDRWKLVATSASAFVDDGMKPVFRVRTRLGRVVETTASHPFLTIDGWKPLAELEVGTRVAVPRTMPVFGDQPMRDAEVKLLGYLLGDGCLRGTSILFTNSNPRVLCDFNDSVEDLGLETTRCESEGRAPTVRVRRNRTNLKRARADFAAGLRTVIGPSRGATSKLAAALDLNPETVRQWTLGNAAPSEENFEALVAELAIDVDQLAPLGRSAIATNASNALAQLLDALGLHAASAHTKHVPRRLFRLPRQQLALFLNRLFATDGWATVLATGQAQLGYASVSRRLASQVQHLLLRFGIIASLRRRVLHSYDDRIAWQLDITDSTSIERFAEQIGIFGKEDALSRAAAAARSKRKQTNRDLIPVEIWQRIAKAKGAETWSSLAKRAGLRGASNIHVGKRALSRGRLAAIAVALGDRGLGELASSDVYWDEIVAIESMGMMQVYDLTILDTHNFVANDICVHNTSLAVGMGTFAALHGPTPTAVFSLEMSKEQLVMRMLCSEGRINSARMRTGFLTEDDWPKLARVAGKLSEAPIFIDDTGSISVLEVRAKCRRLAAESGLGLVIVDYLQLMRGSPNAQSREQEISEISRGLKALAKELRVPVMALSQLNRGLEQRQDKRPVLSDLRESGAIEQDADVIMFVYRDEVYNPESADRGIAEIIIGKQRNGPIGVARSRFFHEYTRFENLAHDDQMPPH